MVDISIIIPVYKVEKFIKKCLDSIKKQSKENFEVIMIDDGSPDESGKICDNYAKIDTRFRVIHQENQGSAMARNRGLSEAKGTYIYFCDPDDYLDSHLLEDNFNLAQEYEANLVVFGHYDEIIKKNNIKRFSKSPPRTAFLKSENDFRGSFNELYNCHIMFTLWNKLYKRAFLLENNLKFEKKIKIGEDTRCNYDVYKDIDKVYLNPKEYYYYIIQRPDSAATKYMDNKFELRYEETKRLQGLINYWENGKKFKDLIYNDYLLTLIIGVQNLYHIDCPYNDKEIQKKVETYLNFPELNIALNKLSIKTLNGSSKERIKRYIYI